MNLLDQVIRTTFLTVSIVVATVALMLFMFWLDLRGDKPKASPSHGPPPVLPTEQQPTAHAHIYNNVGGRDDVCDCGSSIWSGR